MSDRKSSSLHDIQGIPRPTPGHGGGLKLGALALVCLLLLGGAAYWLLKTPEEQESLREQAATALDDATKNSLLEGLGERLGERLRPTPPPPPDYVTNPRTKPGTQAGQNVQGTVGVPIGDADPPAPQDVRPDATAPSHAQTRPGATIVTSPAANANPYAAGPDGTRPVMPKVTEDSRVRADLVQDMAAFLVSRYKPAGGGQLNVTVQNINHRYGQKVNNAAGGGRAGFLRYAFQPTMLNGLYGLYVNKFLEYLDTEAASKNLNETQKRQLHTAIAGRSVMVASALETIVGTPGLEQKRAAYEKQSQNVLDISTQMTNEVFELDQLRDSKAPREQVAAAQMRVDGLAARYRRALDERQNARRQLVETIRKGSGQSLDDDSLLFLAQWVTRRMKEGNQAQASVQSAAKILRDLARRCAAIGAGRPVQAANQGS